MASPSLNDTSYAIASVAFGRAVPFLLLFSFFALASAKNENKKIGTTSLPQAMNQAQAVSA
jgi:hypothetical protein